MVQKGGGGGGCDVGFRRGRWFAAYDLTLKCFIASPDSLAPQAASSSVTVLSQTQVSGLGGWVTVVVVGDSGCCGP